VFSTPGAKARSMVLTHLVYTNQRFSSIQGIARPNTFGSLTRSTLGSGSLEARGRVRSLPAGGGWRRCHSAPLENRTLPFAPLATTAMTTMAKTTPAKTTPAIPLRAPGDGEQQSFPPPAGRHGGLLRPLPSSLVTTTDNSGTVAWGAP